MGRFCALGKDEPPAGISHHAILAPIVLPEEEAPFKKRKWRLESC
jgi:hypothetical protein